EVQRRSTRSASPRSAGRAPVTSPKARKTPGMVTSRRRILGLDPGVSARLIRADSQLEAISPKRSARTEASWMPCSREGRAVKAPASTGTSRSFADPVARRSWTRRLRRTERDREARWMGKARPVRPVALLVAALVAVVSALPAGHDGPLIGHDPRER